GSARARAPAIARLFRVGGESEARPRRGAGGGRRDRRVADGGLAHSRRGQIFRLVTRRSDPFSDIICPPDSANLCGKEGRCGKDFFPAAPAGRRPLRDGCGNSWSVDSGGGGKKNAPHLSDARRINRREGASSEPRSGTVRPR